MKREPRLDTMKDVTQKATRSWRRERTISIRCISLQAFSHSPGDGRAADGSGRGGSGRGGARRADGREGAVPGSMAFSGVALVYHRCQSRGYCSKEFMSPWKLVSLSSSVMLSQ